MLSGPAIKHLVSGTVMHINTPLNTIIPVHYGADGSLAAKAGAMGIYLGAAEDSGRWWVSRTRICHKWKVWFEGKAQCLKLRKQGNRVFWESQQGDSGTAVIKRTKPHKAGVEVAKAKRAKIKTAQVNIPKERLPNNVPEKPESDVVKIVPPQHVETAAKQAPSIHPSHIEFKMASLGIGLSRKFAKPEQFAKDARAESAKKAPTSAPTKKPKRLAKTDLRKTKTAKAVKVKAGLRQTAWRKKSSFRVAHVAEPDVLNIRQGPSETTPIVGGISHRARGVKIVGACQAWWCPVTHGQVSGWVNRFYLAVEH